MLARAPAFVVDPPQLCKQRGHPVDFIENDKFIGMVFEKGIMISQPCAISLCYKIEIDRRPTVTNRTGQRGFSSLARSDQGHRCLTAKGLVQTGNNVSLDHPCRLKPLILICKEQSILTGGIFSGLTGSAITLQDRKSTRLNSSH